MKAKIKNYHKNATFKKAYESDSGFDLTARGYEHKENGLWYIKLGVAVEPPDGHYFEIVPRSSFSKTPFMFPGGVGIIDQGYRGEWVFPVRHVLMPWIYTLNDMMINGVLESAKGVEAMIANDIETFLIGKRIAQAILREYKTCEVEFVDELSKTERGENGLGSSDK